MARINPKAHYVVGTVSFRRDPNNAKSWQALDGVEYDAPPIAIFDSGKAARAWCDENREKNAGKQAATATTETTEEQPIAEMVMEPTVAEETIEVAPAEEQPEERKLTRKERRALEKAQAAQA